MRAEETTWSWRGETIRLGVLRLGTGPTILLLPALSSISTRLEMWPLQQQLATRFSTVAVDWPGFGDLLLVYGGDTPAKSRAEMEALAAVPGVHRAVLPRGKLSVHEEFPAGVAEAIEQFIQDTAERTDPARAAGREPDARGAGRA